MAWRLAKSLITLRDQVNKVAPNRSKASDGTIGDQKHKARKSEHNPNSQGVVCAIDITHDPKHGFDSWAFAEMLRKNADKRVLYIISNHRIANPGKPWRDYDGTNPHTMHVHISVNPNVPSLYDDASPWDLTAGAWNDGTSAPPAPITSVNPLLREGSRGDHVVVLQRLLGLPVEERDGIFGPKTKKAVKDFQKIKDLVDDGVVGPYTWKALGA